MAAVCKQLAPKGYVCTCLCILAQVCVWVPAEARQGCQSWSYRQSWASQVECWEPNVGPTFLQPSLLTTEPLPQLLLNILFKVKREAEWGSMGIWEVEAGWPHSELGAILGYMRLCFRVNT